MRVSLALLSLAFASIQAFTVLPSTHHRMITCASPLSLMTQEEIEKIITQAENCVEGSCSLTAVDDLVKILKEQQKELSDRVGQVRTMIKSLEEVNAKDNRATDEVRETVRAIYRIFQMGDKASGNDYPKLSKPSGYSGDVGKGPTTAWDALPPKKWKAPKA